jgi:hypothetical protein
LDLRPHSRVNGIETDLVSGRTRDKTKD